MLGNSSSALIEAPAVDLPAVDVGDRQLGRRRESNVIHAGERTADVVAALRPGARACVHGARSPAPHPPLADGRAGERIADIIAAWQPPDLPRKPPIPGLTPRRSSWSAAASMPGSSPTPPARRARGRSSAVADPAGAAGALRPSRASHTSAMTSHWPRLLESAGDGRPPLAHRVDRRHRRRCGPARSSSLASSRSAGRPSSTQPPGSPRRPRSSRAPSCWPAQS